jgi:NADPH-dependent 2,4-dienoyl-CoA reductase/sulfur reductase-like enzyme
MFSLDRRQFNAGSAALLLTLATPALARAQGAPKVVIVGGGFGGASIARYLARSGEKLDITLVEKETSYATCPMSNGVIAGLWDIEDISFGYEAIEASGVTVVHDTAVALDRDAKSVALAGGGTLAYDYLVLSPGIQMVWSSIEGYGPEAAEIMPHAWKAGPQTTLLRQQLQAMDDGGLVVIGVPAPPFRCPPGPYERASLIAHYLKAQKPASKLMVLDASESFSKQPLFTEAWDRLYPGLVEWVPASMSGLVMGVDPATMTVSTSFDDFTPAVANIIPAQKAGEIAIEAGLDEGKGFCPVDFATFQSTVAPDIYIIGDATIAGSMPKSGFSANAQAKACGAALLAQIRGESYQPAKLINTCYSLAAPDHGFHIADVFNVSSEGITVAVEDNRTTPVGSPDEVYRAEAEYAHSWFQTTTAEMFG